MRIDTVKTEVYKFDELSDEGKENVLEKFYDIDETYGWWDYIFAKYPEVFTDDYIIEAIRATDCEFTADGSLY